MNNNMLELGRVSHEFSGVPVLRNVSLSVRRNEFVAIVGPSGCGKTTLINILSGYIRPASGSIVSSGRIRTVYQHDGLFPWLTVHENIALGVRGLSEPERNAAIAEMIHFIRLEGFERHYPHQLSGGMRQRVELARALTGDTDILLMDEPFSSLDYLTRLRMRNELALILRERPRTVVLVTHDIEEAAQLADRVVVLTERPAHVRCEIAIALPRPRECTHPEVADVVHRTLETLGFDDDGGERIPHLQAREVGQL
ncbi:MAG: ABC transporter ATP-binding protein [Bacteroidetes bacterium]|nr:ABC transporter ATP-binding protein [Bacteroidota bacterium]